MQLEHVKKSFLSVYIAALLTLLPHWIVGQQKQSKIIQVSVQNESLQTIISQIEEQTALKFAYNPRKIDTEQLITYEASISLQEVLSDLSALLGYEFELIEKQVVIKRKRVSNKENKSTSTISGYIKDAGNGESLIGATIKVKELGLGIVTNNYGFYSITVPNGLFTLTVSYIGFDTALKIIDVKSNSNVSIELDEKTEILEEVIVESTYSSILHENQGAQTNLKSKEIENMPALFGEVDVMKSLETIPGIKAHSDGSAFYYVRGGNRDQNLIMIDDAPIYNSSHLFGVFSTIIPDATNSVNVYKGDMPASLGGRLSSVVDVRTKKGSTKSFQSWGNTGFVATRLGVEGPLSLDRSSYMFSTRFSHIKWVFQQNRPDLKELGFVDVTGKLNFKLNEKNKLYLSTYVGSDRFFEGNDGIEWSNVAGTLRWSHVFNNRLFLNTTLVGSQYEYYLHTDVENKTFWKSRIANLNAKGDFSYFIAPAVTLNFGAGFTGLNMNPGNLSSENPSVRPPLVSIKNAIEGVGYLELDAKVFDKIGLRIGLRGTSWNSMGGAFEFKFDSNYQVSDTLFYDPGQRYKTYNTLEPRIHLSYFLSDNSSIKMAYNRNVQNLHLITNSISPFTSLEVWLPSNINIKPQIANQITAGYYHLFQKDMLLVSLEGFYKTMQNQIDYESHAETLLNPLLEGELRFGEATSYGLEIYLKKELGRISGWAGYTYSRAFRKINEVNSGKEYPTFYDRPHEVDAVLNYQLTERLKIGANWVYSSGSAYSAPVAFYQFNGLDIPVYGEKNNSRLPSYHRLDFSTTLDLQKSEDSRFHHELRLSVYNVYGRKNVLFRNYNKTENNENDLVIAANLEDKTNVVTQTFYPFRAAPSLTYNFRFK